MTEKIKMQGIFEEEYGFVAKKSNERQKFKCFI